MYKPVVLFPYSGCRGDNENYTRTNQWFYFRTLVVELYMYKPVVLFLYSGCRGDNENYTCTNQWFYFRTLVVGEI